MTVVPHHNSIRFMFDGMDRARQRHPQRQRDLDLGRISVIGIGDEFGEHGRNSVVQPDPEFVDRRPTDPHRVLVRLVAVVHGRAPDHPSMR